MRNAPHDCGHRSVPGGTPPSRPQAGAGRASGRLRSFLTTVAGGALALAVAGWAFFGAVDSVVHSSSLTYYVHNNPTPPTGNTSSQTNLPLDQTSPTAATLYNYDTNRDSFAGLVIAKGGTSASVSDTTKYQNWRTAALGTDLTLEGTVNFTFWSGMKDFEDDKTGSVRATSATTAVRPTPRSATAR
jgi:hypothetical protein